MRRGAKRAAAGLPAPAPSMKILLLLAERRSPLEIQKEQRLASRAGRSLRPNMSRCTHGSQLVQKLLWSLVNLSGSRDSGTSAAAQSEEGSQARPVRNQRAWEKTCSVHCFRIRSRFCDAQRKSYLMVFTCSKSIPCLRTTGGKGVFLLD